MELPARGLYNEESMIGLTYNTLPEVMPQIRAQVFDQNYGRSGPVDMAVNRALDVYARKPNVYDVDRILATPGGIAGLGDSAAVDDKNENSWVNVLISETGGVLQTLLGRKSSPSPTVVQSSFPDWAKYALIAGAIGIPAVLLYGFTRKKAA